MTDIEEKNATQANDASIHPKQRSAGKTKQVRSVIIQAPVTFKYWWKAHRMHSLNESEHGAVAVSGWEPVGWW